MKIFLLLIVFVSINSAVAADMKIDLLDDTNISIATGSGYGVYYPIGNNICRLINHDRKSLGLRCKTELSMGAPHNLSMLQNGEVDFALVQSDWAKYGFYGVTSSSQKIKANNQLRFIMSLHDEDLMLLVRRDSNIKAIDQLKGSIISSGSVDSNSSISTMLDGLINVKGWKYSDFKSINSIKLDEQANSLCNKAIDVLTIVSGAPNTIVSEAASDCEISILPFDEATITAITQKYNEFFGGSIEPGIYPGINRTVPTIAAKAVLVTNASTSDKIVYGVTRIIMENLENLKKVHPSLAELDRISMVTLGRTIEMHPGAALYYTEKGYLKKPVSY
ncbi:MAG: TRAP-type putative transport system, periplasmic component [Candidatus Midichloria mitochondrii]